MSISFSVKGYLDRRGARELGAAHAMEQERQDQQLERVWRERVRANVQARLAGKRDQVVIPFYRPRVWRVG